jgi:hypothetical protein
MSTAQPTYDDILRLFQETDRRFQDSDQQLKELGKQMGGLGAKFGSFTEGLALPSMETLLPQWRAST